MNDTTIAVTITRYVESKLAKMGATGKGLSEKLKSLEGYLPGSLVRKIMDIATIRNKVAHESAKKIDDIEAFLEMSLDVVSSLAQVTVAMKKEEGTASSTVTSHGKRFTRTATKPTCSEDLQIIKMPSHDRIVSLPINGVDNVKSWILRDGLLAIISRNECSIIRLVDTKIVFVCKGEFGALEFFGDSLFLAGSYCCRIDLLTFEVEKIDKFWPLGDTFQLSNGLLAIYSNKASEYAKLCSGLILNQDNDVAMKIPEGAAEIIDFSEHYILYKTENLYCQLIINYSGLSHTLGGGKILKCLMLGDVILTLEDEPFWMTLNCFRLPRLKKEWQKKLPLGRYSNNLYVDMRIIGDYISIVVGKKAILYSIGRDVVVSWWKEAHWESIREISNDEKYIYVHADDMKHKRVHVMNLKNGAIVNVMEGIERVVSDGNFVCVKENNEILVFESGAFLSFY